VFCWIEVALFLKAAKLPLVKVLREAVEYYFCPSLDNMLD
jgi:hypothetical protein